MTPTERVVEALATAGCGPRQCGRGWSARCPAHDDRKPSLSVNEGDDGRALLKCHAECATEAIVAAVGLDMGDLFPEPAGRDDEWTPRGPALATYDYTDEQGSVLFQVCRTASKEFPCRRRDPTSRSGWRWKLDDTRRVLYRLPRVLEAVAAGQPVYVVEGEKDVHAVERVGRVATCNPGGAGKWRDEYAEYLKTAEVIVVADRDEAGYRHARAIATSLEGIATRVRLVEAAEGKDVSEHLAAGHSLDELEPADGDGDQTEAPAPRPTWVDTYAHLEFPLDVLPPAIQVFVEQTARSTCVHTDMVATCVLPVLAAAIGNSRSLYVKDDWEERARIYAGIVAESGRRKTPPQRKAVEPLVAIQRDLDRENAASLEEWEELPDKERRRTRKPPYRQLVMNDTTVEAVAKVLDAHPRGVLLERGELSGWLRSFGQYKGGRGDDRQKWLEIYDGLRTAINRSHMERPIVLQRPFVCVLGGIQPAVLGRLLDVDDGFAQRFVYAVPPEVEEWSTTPPVDRAVRGAYEGVVREFYASPTALGDAIPLVVTDDGRETLLGQIQRLMDERRDAVLPGALRSYWAKMEGLLPRLVIVLAEAWRVCGGGTGEVTASIVEMAAAVVDFYKGQALVVLGDEGVVPPAREFGRAGPAAMAELVEWIRRRGGEVTQRDLLTSGPRSVRTLSREEAVRAVAEAVDRGLLVREQGKRADQVVLRVAG